MVVEILDSDVVAGSSVVSVSAGPIDMHKSVVLSAFGADNPWLREHVLQHEDMGDRDLSARSVGVSKYVFCSQNAYATA